MGIKQRKKNFEETVKTECAAFFLEENKEISERNERMLDVKVWRGERVKFIY